MTKYLTLFVFLFRFFSARDKLKNELENEHNKFSSEKAIGIETLGINLSQASDSIEKIREHAEAFVSRGKDAWNLHYADTENALRQRSDESLQHVTGLQVNLIVIIFKIFVIFVSFNELFFQRAKLNSSKLSLEKAKVTLRVLLNHLVLLMKEIFKFIRLT